MPCFLYIEDFITTERIDPVVNPGKVSGHVHSGMAIFCSVTEYIPLIPLLGAGTHIHVRHLFLFNCYASPYVNRSPLSQLVLGGSNFRFNTTTAQLRQSECTSIPIPQDKSAYWFPHPYFQCGFNFIFLEK